VFAWNFTGVPFVLEAMHAKRPLKSYDRTLYGWKDRKAQKNRKRKPYDKMQPDRRRIGEFDCQEQGQHDMTDDKDCEVGRRVIRPVVMQLLATGLANICHA
jgi:hypothetical protein